MTKFIYLLVTFLVVLMFSACGEGDTQAVESQAVSQPAPVNKQAITFPELPSMNAPLPDTTEIEQGN